MTAKVIRANLGYEHNSLADTARRLRKDGHNSTAIEYEDRAQAEQAAYDVLVALGEQKRQCSHDLYDDEDASPPGYKVGANLADWLLANGWPAHPALVDANRIKDDDQ